LDLTKNAFFTTESTENPEKNKSRNSLSTVVKTFPCPGQALIHTAMPCAGIAECGACAVRTRKSWRLACKDGPVFDISELELER
jgi:Leu/Phe-tRNA-protein transferase